MSISLTQSTSSSTSSVSTVNLSFGSNVANGDLILVGINWGNNAGTYSVTDNKSGGSNTYTQFPNVEIGQTSLNDLNAFWAIHSGTAASLQITVTISGGGSHTLRVAIYDYASTSGWQASPVDQGNAFQTTAGSTSGDAGNITPTASGTLVWSAIQWAGVVSNIAVSTSGYSERTAGGSGGNGWASGGRADGGDNQSATTSAQTCHFTWINSVGFSSLIANFLPAGGFTIDQASGNWYADSQEFPFQTQGYPSYSSATAEEDLGVPPNTSILPIPVLAWDEVEWQQFTGLRSYNNPPFDEEPQRLAPLPTGEPIGWDDWDWSRWFDVRVVVDEDERRIQVPPIPTLAWDELEWQSFREARSYFNPPFDEEPQRLAPANTFFSTFGWMDDWDWSFVLAGYDLRQVDSEEFWNPVNLSQINFFDDFEPDYNNIPVLNFYLGSAQGEDEREQLVNPPQPVFLLNVQFDDWDWSNRFETIYAPQTTEEDLGSVPIIQAIRAWDEVEWQRFFALVYAPPTSEEDLSLFANFPPPAVPLTERNEDFPWQHSVDLRVVLGTSEEELTEQPIIPTLAWDDWDWAHNLNLAVAAQFQPEDEQSLLGWFLNPPPPPPPVFCPLPPVGPDIDTSMSVFGGPRPLAVLFCRICKSGRPLIVRADYAIWCQDCCAFVSKADTYMGTVRAPGQLKGIF